MKVGILTVHHSYNYGAMLQAYATEEAIKRLGHAVEFIDYDTTSFISRRKVLLPLTSVGNIFRNIRNILILNKLIKRKRNFEKLYQQLNISKKHWVNYINTSEFEYAVILVGSDQTFSLYLTNNPDEMKPFFLPERTKARKISYASSMGEKINKLTKEDILWISKCLADFDKLSVREVSAQDFIKKNMGILPELVVDPTLLLSREQWLKLITSSRYDTFNDYIAFYTVLSSPDVIRYTQELSLLTGLRVIALHPKTRYEIKSNFEYASDLGPQEFLSVIRNAKYVVTTSFHATVFSIIFHRKFVSILQGEGNRLKSLLNSVDLEERLIEQDRHASLELLEKYIGYDAIDITIERMRERSLNYLKNAIEG